MFDVSDAFSSGPYTVEILNGNDQDRFEVKDGSYSSVSAPSTPAPDTFTLDGETILLCPNATAGPVTPIATISPGTVVSYPHLWSCRVRFLFEVTEMRVTCNNGAFSFILCF